MRITNSMIKNNVVRNINNNLEKLKQVQDQRASGKEINKPSDNPFKISKIMDLQSKINHIDTYNQNIDDLIAYTQTTDRVLESMGDDHQRIKELLLSVGNGTYGEQQYVAIKQEIDQIINNMSNYLNTTFDGKYIFGGTNSYDKIVGTDKGDATKLYIIDKNGNKVSSDSDEYNEIMKNNKKSLICNISEGINIEYNINAYEIINIQDKDGKSINLFELFENISSALSKSDTESINKIKDEYIYDIDEIFQNTTNLRTKVGSIQNRLEAIKNVNENQQSNMTEILSATQDINIAEKLIEYSEIQNVYLSTLQTGASIIQNTILDYLR